MTLRDDALEELTKAVFEAEFDLTWEEAKAQYTEDGEFDELGFDRDHDYYVQAASRALDALLDLLERHIDEKLDGYGYEPTDLLNALRGES